jgi:hypothetical protein
VNSAVHNRRSVRLLIVCLLAVAAFAFSFRGDYRVLFLLPGTQPGQVDTAAAVATCKVCHLAQFNEFYGNMAYACRDPIFLAQLGITSNTTMSFGFDAGEYCLRCHAPSAWMAGRSHWMTVQNMYGSDLDGVNCDFCHRMVDPLHPDSLVIMGGVVPGYGNGMYAVQKYRLPVRGARGLAHPFMATLKDNFYRKSEYCGVCHDESNVYLSDDPQHTPPHHQVLYQRTYSEWLLSWFATQGEAGTCQSCHMTRGPGYGSSLRTTPIRMDVASHDFSGGNTVHMRGVLDTWPGIDSGAVQQGVERSKAILTTAARLELSAGITGGSVNALVRVTNLIGHKLPSGFPEGRRMWISVTGRDTAGEITFESGKYDTTARVLLADPYLKVYETKLGVSHNLAAKYGVTAGPSFNESLNDTVYLDNRIPPKGFSFEKFRDRRAEPIGYHYDDGQYWDVTPYTLPPGTRSVEATLCFQIASREYAEFLRDQNVNNVYDWNNWGAKAHNTWSAYGSPVVMATARATVGNDRPGLPSVDEISLPVKFYLGQNYPNPWNGGTTIDYWLSQPAVVSLVVYDITGKTVAALADGTLPSGVHREHLNGSNLASGIYFYRLSVNGRVDTKKLLLMK